MERDFTINGISFEETITRLEAMMEDLHGDDFCTLVSARDFMEWLFEESSNKYNSANMSVGDQKWLVVQGNNYKFVAVLGTLKKISKKNAGKTYYTFEHGYTTTTFVDSSIGKKIFDTKTDAENAAKELNKK